MMIKSWLLNDYLLWMFALLVGRYYMSLILANAIRNFQKSEESLNRIEKTVKSLLGRIEIYIEILLIILIIILPGKFASKPVLLGLFSIIYLGVRFFHLWKLEMNPQEENAYKNFLLEIMTYGITIILILFLENGINDQLFLEKMFGEFGEWWVQYEQKILSIGTGYLFITYPAGKLIGMVFKRWQKEIEDIGYQGFETGGLWIGIFERVLILTFILMGSFTGIGFILAAKSVTFQIISKPENRKEVEYFMVGTLASFTIAMVAGLIIRNILGLKMGIMG